MLKPTLLTCLLVLRGSQSASIMRSDWHHVRKVVHVNLLLYFTNLSEMQVGKVRSRLAGWQAGWTNVTMQSQSALRPTEGLR